MLNSLMRSVAYPYHLDADPDTEPTFYSDADQDPTFLI
jgi:hypothetical protein